MTLATLIETHGYWVLAIGCLLEGETVLLLAGFAAHRGFLNPYAVLAIASLAGFVGDQSYFWLGRRHGPAILARWPKLARQTDRLHGLTERYRDGVIVGVRFAYGLRIAGPLLMGTSSIAAWRFALFNALGALMWAFAVAGLGWVFGQAAELALGNIRHIEGWLLLGLGVIGVIVWWIRKDRAG